MNLLCGKIFDKAQIVSMIHPRTYLDILHIRRHNMIAIHNLLENLMLVFATCAVYLGHEVVTSVVVRATEKVTVRKIQHDYMPVSGLHKCPRSIPTLQMSLTSKERSPVTKFAVKYVIR